MYKILLCSIIVWLFAPSKIYAQIWDDSIPNYTKIINFHADTLFPDIIGDTASTPLWQIGKTRKTFFLTDTTPLRAMMTDTLHPYPINANNWFILKIDSSQPNVIIDFWHKYQTDSGHDGGVVEYSFDSGTTWMNVVDCFTSGYLSVKTENFYARTDTLETGLAAFTGTSYGEQYSRLQFFDCLAIVNRITDSTYPCITIIPTQSIYLRFRFISDSLPDSLAGWKIDSVKLESPGCKFLIGSVAQINKYQQLIVTPNPSLDGIFQFPALENEQKYNMEVYNAMGEKIISIPYSTNLNLSHCAKGLYFYKVTNGEEYYSGKLMVE